MSSAFLQFNCLIHDETAKKAIESYAGILQDAFQQYQNLWENYIKLQEKYEQCNAPSPFQVMIDKPCTEIKELTPQRQLNNSTKTQEESISLLELDTLNASSINLESNIGADSPPRESSCKDNDSESPSKSPVFSKYLRTGGISVKKFARSPKAASIYDNLTSDMKKHYCSPKKEYKNIIKEYNKKLEISTSQHVATTFLPDGRKLKQSRLVLYPIKCIEKTSPSVQKHKPASILPKVEQESIEDTSVAKASVTAESNAADTFEDVIEISPTQRNITSRLRLKRKTSAKETKSFSTKMYNETNVQKKHQSIINKILNIAEKKNAFEDESFYLPAELAVNKYDTDDFNLDDTENKPPAKKASLAKFDILPKRKEDITEINMRCKADRAKLNGWDCWECEEYYKNLLLSKDELQKRKNQCSRHRHKYERPSTPEGFWDPEFPETLSSTYRQNNT